MKIRTKLLKGIFYCYATIDGIDQSFSGTTVEDAQSQMRALLDVKHNIEWKEVQVIKERPRLINPPIGYGTTRIDHNPLG
jgi:hypothetical protein